MTLKVPAMMNPHNKNGNGTTPGVTGDHDGVTKDRVGMSTVDLVSELWHHLQLPPEALQSLNLETHDGPALPSSYKIGHLAQSSIALSALTAALVHATNQDANRPRVPTVTVPLKHAAAEFKSERLYTIDGKPMPSPWGPIGGLHKTSDGYVRIHDSFPNHRNGVLELLGLPLDAARDDVTAKLQSWTSIDFETVALQHGLAVYALRSEAQWDAVPQSRAVPNHPILLEKLADSPPRPYPHLSEAGRRDRALRGLRVVDMSRVIAAPLAGKTLAAHGADVIWVTSPNLPDLPTIDREFGRGKRTVQLDLNTPADKAKLLELVRSADVLIDGFRPGSLAAHEGLSPAELVAANPGLVYADMSAFGSRGPWAGRRGFDSLVQTCTGMNASEGAHFGEAARVTPAQSLDHGAGYHIAAGVCAALHRRAVEGGSWRVEVSLAAEMKYLRSLGRYPGRTGFDAPDYVDVADCPEEFMVTRDSGFGKMRSVRHSARVEGLEPGWDVMPKPLGSDKPEWL